ncbi:acyltransferase family protein [Sphingobacterium sp. JB170]|uniref:acyltransferase family protein n=1 Tax=Sphingobacterium sp. JB170 TaxID=1434842 RepID=UPI00097E9FD5|nr:acyltransferase family protein [Sphingobacterium sp. JB170]SJN47748.1 O-antigen acetylase [Sphingobacterium sp. JB170]
MFAQKEFRFDIAFLRALAILAVLLYHLRVPYFSAGFVGVDIFFVLSGYLMTDIILGDLSIGKFRLVDFYRRRIRRILPALMVLILVFLLLIYLVLGIKLYDYSRFAFSSSLFVSNIYYYLNSGYFQPDARLNFLLHTWSLSIEWQFYFVYPLILSGLYSAGVKGKRMLGYFLYGLTALSLASMLYYAQRDSSFAFYMFPTRAWELLVGGVVFIHQQDIKRGLSVVARNAIAVVCFLVLFCFIIGIIPHSGGWPSLITLVPVIATAGILLVHSDYKLYANRVTIFIADISYSWYLWHWPLIVLSAYFTFDSQPGWRYAVFFVSLALSVLSYKFVERGTWMRNVKYVLYLSGIVIMTSFLGRQLPAQHILWKDQEASLAQFAHQYPRALAAEQFSFDRGHLLSKSPFSSFDTTRLLAFSEAKKNYLLIGDCHAAMFYHTIGKLAAENNVNLLQATGDETFPVPGVHSLYKGPSELTNYLYDSYFPAHGEKIDKVILSANYSGYSKTDLIKYFTQIETYFKTMGIPTVYIGQTESYRIEYPVVHVMQSRFGISPERYLASFRENANNFLKGSSIADKYVDVYHPTDIIQSGNRQTYMYDADHFSTFGTEQYRTLFKDNIFREH